MEEYQEWIKKAEDDLKAAKYNYSGKLYDLTSFLCQQAVEKALKSLYIKKFKKIKKVHDLVILGKEVGLPENFLFYCKELTAAYVYTRYPGMPEMKAIKESSRKFIKQSEEIITWIKMQLR